jgi:hypothetical protein
MPAAYVLPPEKALVRELYRSPPKARASRGADEDALQGIKKAPDVVGSGLLV